MSSGIKLDELVVSYSGHIFPRQVLAQHGFDMGKEPEGYRKDAGAVAMNPAPMEVNALMRKYLYRHCRLYGFEPNRGLAHYQNPQVSKATFGGESLQSCCDTKIVLTRGGLEITTVDWNNVTVYVPGMAALIYAYNRDTKKVVMAAVTKGQVVNATALGNNSGVCDLGGLSVKFVGLPTKDALKLFEEARANCSDRTRVHAEDLRPSYLPQTTNPAGRAIFNPGRSPGH